MWKNVVGMSICGIIAAVVTNRIHNKQIVEKMPSKLMPVYFLSHGGPTFMYENNPDGDSGAFKKVREIGKEINEIVKPKGIVIFSAHWQGFRDGIEVNTDERSDIIYDFYGFPQYMYEEKFPNKGSQKLGNRVLDLLRDNQIIAKGVSRGLDHGVWVPFMVAFNPKSNPVQIPIVQVSLYKNEDPNKHFELGKALAPLREEGIVIVGSGMTVHNLRDRFLYPGPEPAEWAVTFDKALKDAVTSNVGEERKKALAEVTKRKDVRLAHPHFDHLVPMHVAAGAAYNDEAHCLYTNQNGCFAWGQYRFGDLED